MQCILRIIFLVSGVVAVWPYGMPVVAPEIGHIIRHFHDDVIGHYWQPENRLIDKEYSTIPFPFRRIATPGFTIQRDMELPGILALVRNWSAVQRFVDKERRDPVTQLENGLAKLWGAQEDKRYSSWQLILLVGRNMNR